MKYIKYISTLFFLFLILAVFFVYKSPTTKTESNSPTPITIGWQTPWATQGQLAAILKHTNILSKNNFKAKFKGFTSGAPLNEAALAGDVDVIFTADQPAATLIAANPKWIIIGRLMYNRVSLYVPPNSPIKQIKDLKGKTVGMPFGAAAQRMALKEESEAGLIPGKDVNNINIDILEQSDLVNSKNELSWGNIDALAGFDPTPAIFEEKGLIRNLAVGKVVSVIVMSSDYIKKYPDAPEEFLKSMYAAYSYYKSNVAVADKWFKDESKLDITPHALAVASSLEPNLKSDKSIRLNFSSSDLSSLQEAADFIYNQHLIKNKVDMSKHINTTYSSKLSAD
jgi:sulfonate transport system substrate-binding protein